jgi:AcrR family transcriptional regulator
MPDPKVGTDERIAHAMVTVAARHGYQGATVSRVLSEAGVSRATFYAHFRDRRHCFAEAYRFALGVARNELSGPPPGARGSRSLRALLSRTLSFASAEPDLAAFLLLAAPGAPPAISDPHWRLARRVEERIDQHLTLSETETSVGLPASVLTGGLAGVVTDHLLVGDHEGLPALLDPLMNWLDSYAGARPAAAVDWQLLGAEMSTLLPVKASKPVSTLLPRGSSALDPDAAADLHRRRILEATVALSASDGYEALTVDRITASAHVSRRAFYKFFDDKQHAFLTAQQLSVQRAIAEAAARASVASSWPEAVWLVGEALLSYLARNPDLARITFLEAYAAGAPALRSARKGRMAFALFLERGYLEWPGTAPSRELYSEAIAGAITSLIRRHLIQRPAASLPSLVPLGAYVILGPFLGPAAALEFVEARSEAIRKGALTTPAR